MPTAAIRSGYITPARPATSTPITIAAMTEFTYDSKRSAPIPAISPTLSPTLSAITAGLRGSSSGIPASTLPTRSAPTSAALVKIPPPTRAKSAIKLAPKPKAVIVLGSPKRTNIPTTPKSPTPTTVIPITLPPIKAMFSAPFMPFIAAKAVLPFAFVATFIPTYPVKPLQSAPDTKHIALGTLIFHARRAATIITKGTSALYSL